MLPCIQSCIESPCCQFLRGVNTWLEKDMRSVRPMMFHENGRSTVVMETVTQLSGDGKTGKQGTADLRTDVRVHTRHILHIDLVEDM